MWFHFLFWVAVTVSAEEPLYRKVGDEAVLTPDSVVNPITSITWKHGPDIAMEWYGDETVSYRNFKDHGALDISTGVMTIRRLTRDHSGTYTVEINNKVNREIQLLVLAPVPKPTLSVRCGDLNNCVFTCDGNTTDAEPVTYWWTGDTSEWSATKELHITWDENILWFSCTLRNRLSSNSSEKVFNPFIKREPVYGKIGGEAVLTPGSVKNPITSITWKYGLHDAMEWTGGKISSYERFKDRGTLDISSGVMTITGLAPVDSAIYTAKINDQFTNKIQLLVLSPVPKPTLSVRCDGLKNCVFTCDGDTTGVKLLTSWWTADTSEWSADKELHITWKDYKLWYSCSFKNPVSSESSEHVFNPIMKAIFIISGVTVLYIIINIIFLIYVMREIDIGMDLLSDMCERFTDILENIQFFLYGGNYCGYRTSSCCVRVTMRPVGVILFMPVFIIMGVLYLIFPCVKALQKKCKRKQTPGVSSDISGSEMENQIPEMVLTRGLLTAVDTDTNSETERLTSLPALKETSTQDTSTEPLETCNETAADPQSCTRDLQPQPQNGRRRSEETSALLHTECSVTNDDTESQDQQTPHNTMPLSENGDNHELDNMMDDPDQPEDV